MTKLILSLCDLSGSWPKPYEDSKLYKVERIELKEGQDVRLLKFPSQVHGILAAPPCTHFASSGARWWAGKGDAALLEGLSVVDACLRIILMTKPKWWALENPVGRLKDYLGPPVLIFDPCDFGDPYTKKTLLWGNFTAPKKLRVSPIEGSKMHLIPGGKKQSERRSVTPAGFADAFFKVNA